MRTSLHQAVIILSKPVRIEITVYGKSVVQKIVDFRESEQNHYDKLFPEKTFCIFYPVENRCSFEGKTLLLS